MELIQTNIDGVFIIKSQMFIDSRGEFTKIVHEELLTKLDFKLSECFFSRNNENVICEMHFQRSPLDLQKIVFCTAGSILDVLLDIRPHSSTFGKAISVELSEDTPIFIFLPKGVAHGFKTLSTKSTICYLQSQQYSKEHDDVIHYNSFGFDWNLPHPTLSARDSSAKTFNDFFNL